MLTQLVCDSKENRASQRKFFICGVPLADNLHRKRPSFSKRRKSPKVGLKYMIDSKRVAVSNEISSLWSELFFSEEEERAQSMGVGKSWKYLLD